MLIRSRMAITFHLLMVQPIYYVSGTYSFSNTDPDITASSSRFNRFMFNLHRFQGGCEIRSRPLEIK